MTVPPPTRGPRLQMALVKTVHYVLQVTHVPMVSSPCAPQGLTRWVETVMPAPRAKLVTSVITAHLQCHHALPTLSLSLDPVHALTLILVHPVAAASLEPVFFATAATILLVAAMSVTSAASPATSAVTALCLSVL